MGKGQDHCDVFKNVFPDDNPQTLLCRNSYLGRMAGCRRQSDLEVGKAMVKMAVGGKLFMSCSIVQRCV